MADPHGFLNTPRQDAPYRPVKERIGDYREVELPILPTQVREQAGRCMDCGIPYCHAHGCPVENRIPEFNELVRLDRWEEAAANLHSTNNFPEFTGRTCPAPCEPACTLALDHAPVTIKNIENAIIEKAWENGWVIPEPPTVETGRSVAIIGSGPAGLAAAQQLRRLGHAVVVYERDREIGGLLRYGIPDFKLEKHTIDRRLAQLAAEGVLFETGVEVGADISAAYLQKHFDAIVLAIGASVPRDLDVPGRMTATNVHFAMEYLTRQNRIVAGADVPDDERIDARDKVVAVIGGGDTGSDCVGTAIRQGARAVYQLNYHDTPPERHDPLTIWPNVPHVLETSSSHAEGCERKWNLNTKGFVLDGDRVTALNVVRTRWEYPDGGRKMIEIEGSDATLPVDLVLLACGFKHPEQAGVLKQLAAPVDPRGRVRVNAGATDAPGVFAAGDCVLGASLVVNAIRSGRDCAQAVADYLARIDSPLVSESRHPPAESHQQAATAPSIAERMAS